MATLIFYNGINPFSGIAVVNTIQKVDDPIRPHTRWGMVSNLTIKGQITGAPCTGDFNLLIQRQRQLLTSFADDHKNLVIQDNGSNIYTAPYSVIKNINFPANRYVKVLPFEISISCFQNNLFSGVYGIQEPNHSVDYSEEEDGIINCTRTIGAKGFNTIPYNNSGNSLDNARNWVQARTGWSRMDSMGYPSFVTITGGLVPCLKEFKEEINRFEGSYEVTETYEFKDGCSGTSLLRYSTDIDYNDQEGLYSVSLEGDFNACYDLTIAGLRTAFSAINTYDLANNALLGVFPTAPNLNGEWLSKSIEEDTNKKNITFRFNYNTDYIPKVMFQPEYTVDFDYIEDLHSISIEGRVVGRGSQKERWERVFNYYNTQINIFNLVNDFYSDRSLPYVLNPHPVNIETTFDKFAGEITISATYNNRPLPPGNFKEWDYTITVEPAINLYSYIPNLCQDYVVMNLRAKKRALASIEGEALSFSTSDQSSTIRNSINTLLMPFLNGDNQILKVDSIERSLAEQGNLYNFTRSVAFNGDVFNI